MLILTINSPPHERCWAKYRGELKAMVFPVCIPVMNYPLPNIVPDRFGASSRAQTSAVQESELITALQVVILSARANGQSLEDLTAEVLAEDMLLDPQQRQILSEIVTKAWDQVPTIVSLASTPLASAPLASAPLASSMLPDRPVVASLPYQPPIAV
jgi:hypothetical protein